MSLPPTKHGGWPSCCPFRKLLFTRRTTLTRAVFSKEYTVASSRHTACERCRRMIRASEKRCGNPFGDHKKIVRKLVKRVNRALKKKYPIFERCKYICEFCIHRARREHKIRREDQRILVSSVVKIACTLQDMGVQEEHVNKGINQITSAARVIMHKIPVCNFWDQYRSKRPRLNDSLESQEIILNNLILRKGDKGEELKQKIKYLFDDSDSDEIKYIENTKRVEGEKKNVSPSKKIISKTSIEVDVIKYKSTVLDVENISDSADLNHNSSKILQLPEPAVLNKNLLLPNNLESEKLSNDSITLKPKDVIESKLRNENESNAQFEDYNNTYTNLKENDKNKLNINTITKSSKKDMPLVDFDNTVSTVNINYYTENNICTEKQVNEKQNLSLNDSTKENVSSESNNDAENSLNILSSAITSNSDQVLPDSTGLDEHLEGGDFDFLGSMHNNRNDSEYDEYESDTEYNLDTAERSTDINQIVQNKNVIKNEPLENISYELDKHHLKQPLKTEPRLNKFVDDETDDNDCQIIDHFINLDAEDEQILKYKNIDKVSELTESEIVTSSRAPTSNTLNDTCIENSVENNKDNLVLMNTPTEDDPAVAPASPLSSNIECQDLITEMPCNNPITTNSSQFTGNIDEDFNNPHVLNAFNLTREIIAPDEIKIEVSTESNDLLVHKSLENIKKIIQEKNYVSELPSFAQTIDSSVSCIEKTIDNITPQLIIEVSPNVESENSYDLLKDININLVNEIDDAGKSLGNNSIKLRDINQLLENPKNSKRKELPQQDLATNLQFSRSIEIKDNNNSQNIQEHVVYDSDSIQKVITRTIQVNTSSNVLETTLMTSNVSAVSSGNEPITPTRSKQILHQPQVISSLCPTLPISQNNQILSNDISRTENLSSLTNSSNNVVYASNLFPNMFANLNDKDDKVNIFKLPVPIQLRTVVLPEPFRFKLDDTESVMIDKIVQYKNILLDKLYGSLWTIGSMTRETCIKHIMALCNKTTLTFETWELHANIIIIKKCVESFRKLTVNNSYTNICSAITISIKEFKESIPPIDVKTVLKLYALLENKKVISSEDQTSEPLIEELHQIMQRRQNKENSINLDQLQRYNQQLNAYKSICIQNKLIIMQMISR